MVYPNEYEKQYNSSRDQAVFEILERYYWAIENGTVDKIVPSASFKFEDDVVQRVISGIDEEFTTERLRSHHHWSIYDADPDFHRMPINAQRAMVEELY